MSMQNSNFVSKAKKGILNLKQKFKPSSGTSAEQDTDSDFEFFKINIHQLNVDTWKELVDTEIQLRVFLYYVIYTKQEDVIVIEALVDDDPAIHRLDLKPEDVVFISEPLNSEILTSADTVNFARDIWIGLLISNIQIHAKHRHPEMYQVLINPLHHMDAYKASYQDPIDFH